MATVEGTDDTVVRRAEGFKITLRSKSVNKEECQLIEGNSSIATRYYENTK